MRAVFQMRGNYELEIHTLMIIMCKRTRKEIASLFNIFDGNLVNANKTVRSKWANLFENLLSRYRAELERITIGFRKSVKSTRSVALSGKVPSVLSVVFSDKIIQLIRICNNRHGARVNNSMDNPPNLFRSL